MPNFLVATHNNLLIVKLNDELTEGEVGTFASGARYYGIAETPQGEVFVAKNTRDPNYITRIEDLVSGRVIPFEKPLRDVHQITYGNGGLYITNTGYNGVVYKNLTTGVEHHYTIGGPFEHDYAHPNSIWLESPYVYVMLHNKRFRRSELCRLIHSPERGWDTGYHSELRFRVNAYACHNMRFDGSLLTILASEVPAATQIDHLTGTPMRGFPYPEGLYVKAMATWKDKLIVGANPLVSAKDRYSSHAALGISDLLGDKGFLHLINLTLPDGEPVANINEIRLLRTSLGLDSEASEEQIQAAIRHVKPELHHRYE